jgi:hypothetical protein
VSGEPKWADLLERLPTVRWGRYGALKVETDTVRVWLARRDSDEAATSPWAYARSVLVESHGMLMGELDGDRPGPPGHWGTLRTAWDLTVAVSEAQG